jgi:hypothetical protein
MGQTLNVRDIKGVIRENLLRELFGLWRMKICLLFLYALWSLGPDRLSLAAPSVEGGGPFPNRNYNPVQLLFLSLPSERATTLPRDSYEISLEVAESNTILNESSPQIDATLKFETFRSALHLKYGFTDRAEIGLEIPYYYRNGGFLDPFIMSVEHDFGSLNPERIKFTDGSFGGYAIIQDGTVIVSGEDHQTGFGDVTLSGKYLFHPEGPGTPAAALRIAVKFPTGDLERAFGSGKADFGMGLVLQKSMARRWLFYLNQSVVLPGGDFGPTDLTLRAIYSAALAAEFIWTPSFSLVGQLDYYSSPFHGTGARVLDNGVFESAWGFNYRFKSHLLFQLFGIENFANPESAAADFTLGTNIAVRF